jgi:hypothetical protein
MTTLQSGAEPNHIPQIYFHTVEAREVHLEGTQRYTQHTDNRQRKSNDGVLGSTARRRRARGRAALRVHSSRDGVARTSDGSHACAQRNRRSRRTAGGTG